MGCTVLYLHIHPDTRRHARAVSEISSCLIKETGFCIELSQTVELLILNEATMYLFNGVTSSLNFRT